MAIVIAAKLRLCRQAGKGSCAGSSDQAGLFHCRLYGFGAQIGWSAGLDPMEAQQKLQVMLDG
jgi:hypothetical protein